MAISLTEDFKTVKELEREPLEILKQVRRTGRPVVVTVNGKPDVVIMDAATYERKLQNRTLAQLLAEGEADIRAGRTRPAAEVFDELIREKKVSRRNDR